MSNVEENVEIEEFYVFEEESKNAFLEFPKNLYSDKEYHQDVETEKAIIEGRHSLNHDFEVHFFLAFNKEREPLARALLTFYHNDSNAYLSFFECINNVSVGTMFLKHLKKYSSNKLCTRLVGPYDCSWWISKGLKIEDFGKPIYMEPYNLAYYPMIFQSAGFQPIKKYSTYTYNKTIKDPKYLGKTIPMQNFLSQGYSIVNFDEKKFDTQIQEALRLLLNVPNPDPFYKRINEREFMELNKNLKETLSYKYSRMFYFKNQLVGFYIAMPDYSNYLTQEYIVKTNMVKSLQSELTIPYFAANPNIPGFEASMEDYIRNDIGTKVRFDIFGLSEDNLYYYKDTIKKKINYILYAL